MKLEINKKEESPSYRSEIRRRLLGLAEEPYRKFSANLNPVKENLLGVRLPALRSYAKELAKGDWRSLLACYGIVPGGETVRSEGTFMEEDLVCGLALSYVKTDFEEFEAYFRAFVPKIDNWALCDCVCMGIRLFDRFPERGFALVEPYFDSGAEYENRVAAVCSLAHFLTAPLVGRVLKRLVELSRRLPDEPFEKGAPIYRSPYYYAKMAVAWAFAESFLKFPEETKAAFAGVSHGFIRRKAIAKSLESRRIAGELRQVLIGYRNEIIHKEV